jgi:hypothetical protein
LVCRTASGSVDQHCAFVSLSGAVKLWVTCAHTDQTAYNGHAKRKLVLPSTIDQEPDRSDRVCYTSLGLGAAPVLPPIPSSAPPIRTLTKLNTRLLPSASVTRSSRRPWPPTAAAAATRPRTPPSTSARRTPRGGGGRRGSTLPRPGRAAGRAARRARARPCSPRTRRRRRGAAGPRGRRRRRGG